MKRKLIVTLSVIITFAACIILPTPPARTDPPGYDGDAPVITITHPTPGQPVGMIYAYSGNVTDVGSGVKTVFVKFDDGEWTNVGFGNDAWSTSVYLTNDYGWHTNYAYAVDNYSNASITQSVAFIRAAVPVVAITNLTDYRFTNATQIEIGGTVVVDSPYYITNVVAQTNGAGIVNGSGTNVWTVTIDLKEGTNTIVVRAFADNGMPGENTIHVIVDTIPPVIVSTSILNGQETDVVPYPLSGVASDNYSVAAVYLSVSGGPFRITGASENWATNIRPVIGFQTNRIFAIDAVGNIGTTNMTIYFVFTNVYNNACDIIVPPPFGLANAFMAVNTYRPLVAPISYSGVALTNWRFDLNGDGTWDTGWIPTNTYSCGYSTSGIRHVAAEAISGDRKYRLYYTNNSIRVTAGGSASFTETNSGTLTGVLGSSIALGDIDGDNDLDLILTGYTASSTYISSVYRNSSGAFTSIQSLTGVNNSSTAFGDINGDGELDLVIAGYYYSGGGYYTLTAYRNEGSGSFAEIQDLTGLYHASIALGDIDLDGDLDLVATGNTGAARFTMVYRNNGSGSFSTDSQSLTAVDYSSIALGDINTDGFLDLIITGSSATGFLSTAYTNDGTGNFISMGSLLGVREGSIALGDIDGDSDLDLVLTGTNSSGYISRLYQNDGLGNYASIQTLTGVQKSSVVLGDINGDSRLDLILSGWSSTALLCNVYTNTGTASFALDYNIATLSSGSLALGDIDGDADLDLILTGSITGTASARFYRNN